MLVTQYTGQEFTLAQDIEPNIEYSTIAFTITKTPPWTGGIVKVDIGDNSEWFVVENLVLVEGDLYQADVITRAFAKDATTTTATDAELSFAHSKGAVCKTVTHSYVWDQKWLATDGLTLSDDNTFTGTQTYSSDTNATLILQSVTTAVRDTLSGVSLGAMIYNSTTQTLQYYNGAWVDVPTGDSNKNASETEQGKVGLATPEDHRQGAEGTLTKAAMAIQSKYLIKEGSVVFTDDAYKCVILDSTGKIQFNLVAIESNRWGGDRSDGILNSSTVITGDNDSYIQKNYDSVVGGSFTLSTNTRNSIIHIRVKGDADFSNWAFNFNGVGASAVSNSVYVGENGESGKIGNATCQRQNAGAGGGEGSGRYQATNPLGGVPATSLGYTPVDMYGYAIYASCGGGGANGGGGATTLGVSQSVSGGFGEAGGGCIIIEVGGDVTFSSTTVNIEGIGGANGADSDDVAPTAVYDQSGGGGGGAGGTFICLYSGSVSGSPTVNKSGGAGGIGGSLLGANYVNRTGAGGAGGSNIFFTGSAGADGVISNAGNAGSGGAGATGYSYIGKQTTRA